MSHMQLSFFVFNFVPRFDFPGPVPQSQGDDQHHLMDVDEPEEARAMMDMDNDDNMEEDLGDGPQVEDEEEFGDETDVRRSRRSRRQPDRLAGGKRSGRTKYAEDESVSSNEEDDDDFDGRPSLDDEEEEGCTDDRNDAPRHAQRG